MTDFAGAHLIADLVGCRADLDDHEALGQLAVDAAEGHGATVLDVLGHEFDPSGVTVLVMLAESHVSIHTWPERAAAHVDVFTCGSVAPAPIMAHIVRALDPTEPCRVVEVRAFG